MSSNLWWGYKHVNGSYQAKRYFDKIDITDAISSSFVANVVGPFEAEDRAEALLAVFFKLSR